MQAWHDGAVPVVIFLVAAVILGGIVVLAIGRGGELARDKVEMPVARDLRTWSDVASYRPPPALLGYHAASTEQALMNIARTIAGRDAEIAWLRSRLSELQPESADHGAELMNGPDADAQIPADADAEDGAPERGLAASERRPDPGSFSAPEGSHASPTAEPPVQAGYWPQVGPAGRSSDE